MGLKFAMRRDHRAALARLFYELAVLPGLEPRVVETASNMACTLLESRKRIDIRDLQLPWRPLHSLLERELFPKRRKTGLTTVSAGLLGLAEYAQRFYPPHEADSMLETMLPRFNGARLDSVLATQSFLVHFLPLSHPQSWLPAVFSLWDSFSSQMWTDQWLELMSRLAELHVDPAVSDPRRLDQLRAMADGAAGGETPAPTTAWSGIRKDVGIFTDVQWQMIMTKCVVRCRTRLTRADACAGWACRSAASRRPAASSRRSASRRPTSPTASRSRCRSRPRSCTRSRS